MVGIVAGVAGIIGTGFAIWQSTDEDTQAHSEFSATLAWCQTREDCGTQVVSAAASASGPALLLSLKSIDLAGHEGEELPWTWQLYRRRSGVGTRIGSSDEMFLIPTSDDEAGATDTDKKPAPRGTGTYYGRVIVRSEDRAENLWVGCTNSLTVDATGVDASTDPVHPCP